MTHKNDNSENAEELFKILCDVGSSSANGFKNYVEGKGEQEKALVININSKSLERITRIQLEKQKRLDDQEERNRQYMLQERREERDFKIKKYQAETERIKVLNDLVINLKNAGCSITREELEKMHGISEPKVPESVKSQGKQKQKIISVESKADKRVHNPHNMKDYNISCM